MQRMRWVLLVVPVFLTGYFLVEYLVCRTNQMGLYAAVLTLAFIGSGYVLLRWFQGKILFAAGVVGLAGLVAGYATANAAFLSQQETRQLPAVTRTDGGDGHTAVIYFTHGEPPGYNPMPWIETIRELDHDHVPFVPWLVRPIFFNTSRHEYFEAGGSAHNELHRVFIETLARSLPDEEAKGTRFYLAFLDSNPRPDEMAIRAINDGASKIIILPVFITESTHTQEGQKMVASVQPDRYGIQVCYTGPLWDSEPLQKSFVQRADEMLEGTDKSKVGILLVGHGQPTEWEKIYPAENKQEDQFRQAIRNKLIADGYVPDQVVLGWMEFQQPGITDSVQALSGRGVEKIFIFAATLSADSIHSDVEIPAAVEKAHLPSGIKLEYVGQYGDHPLAIQALIEKIKVCQ